MLRERSLPCGATSINLESRCGTWEVVSQAWDLAHELQRCQAELKESEDKRRAGNIRFVKVVERLRLQSARIAVIESRGQGFATKVFTSNAIAALQLD